MQILALVMMFIALCLLYRIAFPRQATAKGCGASSRERDADTSGAVVKSRFIRPNRSQPLPTCTGGVKAEVQIEKPSIFAGGNEGANAVAAAIPLERLAEVFGTDPDLEDLDIAPDGEEIDPEEEMEDLRQVLGRDMGQAGGWSMEEMAEAVEAIDNPTEGKGEILYRAEKTDMFERLVSADTGKAARIRAVIDRHLRRQGAEGGEDEDNEENANEWKNFDMQEFLS